MCIYTYTWLNGTQGQHNLIPAPDLPSVSQQFEGALPPLPCYHAMPFHVMLHVITLHPEAFSFLRAVGLLAMAPLSRGSPLDEPTLGKPATDLNLAWCDMFSNTSLSFIN